MASPDTIMWECGSHAFRPNIELLQTLAQNGRRIFLTLTFRANDNKNMLLLGPSSRIMTHWVP